MASVLEAVLTFVLFHLAVGVFGISLVTSMACALVAVATSLAVVVTATKDLRAQGEVTERVMRLTALDTAYAVIGLAQIVVPLVLSGVLAVKLLSLLRPSVRRLASQF